MRVWGNGGHAPVLLEEAIEGLAVRSGGIYVDATFGGGGHSRAMLAAGAGLVIAIDRDPDALTRGRSLARELPGLTVLDGPFSEMAELVPAAGVSRVDGVLMDLGLSSFQLADAGRGFSFAADGPLDMRMGATGNSAAEVVNSAGEAELVRIFRELGEEPRARRLARAIVARRREAPFARTGELAGLVRSVVGGAGGRIDPATRAFQALRIFVNDELGEIERALPAAERILAPGGRLVVISFHSLEDRIVKRYLRERSGGRGAPSRHLPMPDREPVRPAFRVLSRRVVTPGPAEVARNPRARSARMRVAERLDDGESEAPVLESSHMSERLAA